MNESRIPDPYDICMTHQLQMHMRHELSLDPWDEETENDDRTQLQQPECFGTNH